MYKFCITIRGDAPMRVATSNAITQFGYCFGFRDRFFRSFSGLTANNTANAVTFGYKTGIGKHGGETG